MTFHDWQEWLKAVASVWGIAYPVLILPALEALRRLWRSYRRLREDVSKVLRALRILATRERRHFDIQRRLIWALRFEQKRGILSRETVEVLAQLQRETDELRETAFRAPELRKARLSKGVIFQGETDANPLSLLSEEKG